MILRVVCIYKKEKMSVRESVKKVGMLEKEKKKERKIREKKRETERERERIERAWKMISFKCVCVYLSVLAYA